MKRLLIALLVFMPFQVDASGLQASFTGSNLDGLTRPTTRVEYKSNLVPSSGNLIDSSGRSHDLAPTGGTPASTTTSFQDSSGRRYIGRAFDGSGMRYSVAHHADFNMFDANHTVTLVVLASSSGAGTDGLFGHFDANGGMEVELSGTNYMMYYGKAGGLYVLVNNAGTYRDDKYHVVQIVRESDYAIVYVDGVAGTKTSVSGYGLSATATLDIGASSGGFTPWLGNVLYVRADAEALSLDRLNYERNQILGIGPRSGTADFGLRASSTDYDFSRTSTASLRYSDGSMSTFGTGMPRVGGDGGGVLIEGQSTNLALQSQTLNVATWVPLDTYYDRTPVVGDYEACLGASSTGATVLTGHYGKRLWLSTTYGTGWVEQTPDGAADKNWMGCAVSGDGQVLLAGIVGNYKIYKSTNAGGAWAETQPAGATTRSWGTAALDQDGSVALVCVGNATNGRCYVSTDTLGSWTDIRPTGADENKDWFVATVSSTTGVNQLASVNGGRIYISKSTGALGTWAELCFYGACANGLYSGCFSPDGTKMLGTVYGGKAYLSTNIGSGDTFTEVMPTGSSVSRNWKNCGITNDGLHMYVAIDSATNGNIYVSNDGGATWRERQPAGDVDYRWYAAAASTNLDWIYVQRTNAAGGVYAIATDWPSVNSSTYTAPDATSTADGVVGSTVDTVHGFTQAVTLTAVNHAISVLARPGDKNWIYLSDDTVANGYTYCNVRDCIVGTKGAGAVTNSAMQYANGWCKCSVTVLGTAAAHTIKVAAANADTDNTFAGDGSTINVWAWGVQTETGGFATSYTPTTTASATRTQDSLTLMPIKLGKDLRVPGVAEKMYVDFSQDPTSATLLDNTGTYTFTKSGTLTATDDYVRGRRFSFNGTDSQYVLTDAGAVFRPAGNFSVVAVVKPDALPTGGNFMYIVGKYTTTGDKRSWAIYYNDGGDYTLAVSQSGASGTTSFVQKADSVQLGRPTLLVATFECSDSPTCTPGNTHTAKLYVDDTTVSTDSAFYGPANSNDANMNIGRSGGGSRLQGELYWVAYYDGTVLSQTQVTALYNKFKQANILPTGLGSGYVGQHLTIEFEAKCAFSSSTDMGADRTFLSLGSLFFTGTAPGGATSTRNYIKIYASSADGKTYADFYSGSSTTRRYMYSAAGTTYNKWHKYKVFYDFSNLASSNIWVDGSAGTLDASMTAAAHSFNITDLFVRVGQPNAAAVTSNTVYGTTDGFCSTRNLRVYPARF